MWCIIGPIFFWVFSGAWVITLGFESDCSIRCRLINVYVKYMKVKDAEKAFKRTRVNCWYANAVVANYMQNVLIEAIKAFPSKWYESTGYSRVKSSSSPPLYITNNR